jgi:hypothetical protein
VLQRFRFSCVKSEVFSGNPPTRPLTVHHCVHAAHCSATPVQLTSQLAVRSDRAYFNVEVVKLGLQSITNFSKCLDMSGQQYSNDEVIATKFQKCPVLLDYS